MQKFTKNEIIWIIGEMDKAAASLKNRADQDSAKGLAAGLMNLRSEQFANIADKLQKVIDENNKRIEITY